MPFLLYKDFQAFQIIVALPQQLDDDNPKNRAIVSYWSRSVTDVERRYSASEREILVVVRYMITLRHYIEGTHLTIWSDHNPLCSLMTVDDRTGRLIR